MDEPTSGLDSHTAYSVVKTFKDMAHSAENPRTILMSIHQPSSEIFALFDRLMLLVDGHVIYMGPADEAVAYFADLGFQCPQYSNPADYFMSLMNEECKSNPEALQRLVDAYKDSAGFREAQGIVADGPCKLPASSNGNGRVGVFDQLLLLSQRSLRNYVRQPFLLRSRIGQQIFLGLLAGLLYLGVGSDQTSVQDRFGALFFLTVSGGMTSVMSVLLTFPGERALYLREQASDMYRPLAYFISKFTAEFPFQLLFPLIYSSISYWLIGLQNDFEKFVIFYASNALLVNVGTSLGMLIGCAAARAESAVAMAPVALVPFIVVGGLFLNSDNVPVYFVWLESLSLFRWNYETLFVNEFSGLELTCSSSDPTQCPYSSGEDVISAFSFDHDNIARNFGILFGLFAGFRVLAFIALKWQSRAR